MEFKKKTIIWEDNNEPPKDYIWAKKDGKFYEYSHTQRAWIESTSISSGSNSDSGSGNGSGSGSGSGGDGGGSGDNSDIFFAPAAIQPKYFINEDDTEPIEIKNYTLDGSLFLYNKEDIISLGVNEEDLNSLNILGIEDIWDETDNNSFINGLLIPKENFYNKVVLYGINPGQYADFYGRTTCYVYKISDNIFIIIEGVEKLNPNPGGIDDPML